MEAQAQARNKRALSDEDGHRPAKRGRQEIPSAPQANVSRPVSRAAHTDDHDSALGDEDGGFDAPSSREKVQPTTRNPLRKVNSDVQKLTDSGYGTSQGQSPQRRHPSVKTGSTIKQTEPESTRLSPAPTLPPELEGLDAESQRQKLLQMLQTKEATIRTAEATIRTLQAKNAAQVAVSQTRANSAAASKEKELLPLVEEQRARADEAESQREQDAAKVTEIAQVNVVLAQKNLDLSRTNDTLAQALKDSQSQQKTAEEQDILKKDQQARLRLHYRGRGGVLDSFGDLTTFMIVWLLVHTRKGILKRPFANMGIDTRPTNLPWLDLVSCQTLNMTGVPSDYTPVHKDHTFRFIDPGEYLEYLRTNDPDALGGVFTTEMYEQQGDEHPYRPTPPLHMPTFIDTLQGVVRAPVSMIWEVSWGYFIPEDCGIEMSRSLATTSDEIRNRIDDYDAGRPRNLDKMTLRERQSVGDLRRLQYLNEQTPQPEQQIAGQNPHEHAPQGLYDAQRYYPLPAPLANLPRNIPQHQNNARARHAAHQGNAPNLLYGPQPQNARPAFQQAHGPPPFPDPQTGYGAQGGYETRGNHRPREGCGPQRGYGPQGGYAPQGGYGAQRGYEPPGGYGPQRGYGPQGGYAHQQQQGGFRTGNQTQRGPAQTPAQRGRGRGNGNRR